MLLEKIKDFNWVNEPKNVEFIEKGLLITTKEHTDFWQNSAFNISKDDGHFFACVKEGDFSLTTKWSFEKFKASAQCGLMIKSDAKNWIKAGVLPTANNKAQIGVVVANNGVCDWSVNDIEENTNSIYFNIKRKGTNFIVYYSIDSKNYNQIRLVNHPHIRQVIDVGAYACSPKNESFDCVLEEIELV